MGKVIIVDEDKMSRMKEEYTQLQANIDEYGSAKITEKLLKKSIDTLNGRIKDAMRGGLDKIAGFKYEASFSVREDESLIEDEVIRILEEKKLGKGILKKRVYVDFDALEDAIYNGKISAAMLESAKTSKIIETLRVKEIKVGNEEKPNKDVRKKAK
jgi:hypothetical protein